MLFDDNIKNFRLFFAEICGNYSEKVFFKTTLKSIILSKNEVLKNIYAIEQVLYSKIKISNYKS